MGTNSFAGNTKNTNYYYIWIDSKINNQENSEYSKVLKIKYPSIVLFENINDAIKYFKKIKFKITFIIVSGSLFPQFISSLKKVENTILTFPRIIIFTSETTKPKIEKIGLVNDSFYNIGGLVISFEEVVSFLNKNIFGKELNFIRALTRKKIQTKGEFTFQLIDNINDLAGPIYFIDFIGNPDEEDIIKFDKHLIDNYGDEMRELISQIFNIDCPISLRIKYWLRAYTLETKFYKDMNSDLMKDNNLKLYLPYVKILYSGLSNNLINFNVTNNLYRGGLISKEEIENLLDLMSKKKKSDIPYGTLYSKAFMSFSLDINVAIDFMERKIPTEKTVRVLYILKAESELDHKNATNVDLEGISYFEDEREILLFPYSVYEINDIRKLENYYEIYLNYLGKYKRLVNFKNKSHLIKSIDQTEYIKKLGFIGLLTHKNSLCIIKVQTKNSCFKASGFCCLIPLQNKKIKIPLLITCHHVLNESNIKNNDYIHIEYLNKLVKYRLKKTKIYFNEKYDITIIEIEKNSDIFKENIFMDVDQDIFEDLKEIQKKFHNQEVLIPQYTERLMLALGKIEIVNDYEINYNNCTTAGSSGAPIFSNKLKVIGYHIGCKKKRTDYINFGGLLKISIQKYIETFYI